MESVAMIVAGPIWGSICGKKYMVPVPEHVANQEDFDESKLPKFGTIVLIILIPLVLIILKSLAGVVPAMATGSVHHSHFWENRLWHY